MYHSVFTLIIWFVLEGFHGSMRAIDETVYNELGVSAGVLDMIPSRCDVLIMGSLPDTLRYFDDGLFDSDGGLSSSYATLSTVSLFSAQDGEVYYHLPRRYPPLQH